MKTRLAVWSGILFALACLLAPLRITAVPVLQLRSGGTTVTVQDGDPLDSSPVPGIITYVGGIGAFNVTVTSGRTKPNVGQPWSPRIDVEFYPREHPGGTLTLQFSETDFEAVPPFEFITAVGGTLAQSANGTFRLYANASNQPLDTSGTAWLQLGPFAGGAFDRTSTAGATVTTPYSITLEAVITHPPSGTGIASSFALDLCASNAITTPPGTNVANVADIPPAATTIEEFLTLGGRVANCSCTDLILTHQDELINTNCPALFMRTYTMTDCESNSVSDTQVFTLNDGTAPVLQFPADLTVNWNQPFAFGCPWCPLMLIRPVLTIVDIQVIDTNTFIDTLVRR